MSQFVVDLRTLATGGLLTLCACASPAPSQNMTVVADQKLGDICSSVMGFDVSSMYYASCRDYLRRHSQPPAAEIASRTYEPAEHAACRQIGLQAGTPEYASCVSKMYDLDLGNAHL